jgi:hypothetical protein
MEVITLSGDQQSVEEFWQKKQQSNEFELWDENVPAFQLFQQCQTQWNVSMTGITGMNYPAVQSVMSMSAIPRKKQPNLFEEFRFIESGFLTAVSEQRKNNG